MLQNTRHYNEYANAAFAFSLLSLIGSLLSIINVIPLIITYQLLSDAKKYGAQQRKTKIVSYMFELALFLTLAITIFYMTFQR